MNFKSLLTQLDQLNEATDRSEPGKVKHTAEPGGYGRKDDEDEEGNKVKDTTAEKKGRGRPAKATQSSGEDKKYDFSAFGVKAGKDVKLPKYDKKKTKKHSIKEYLDQMYEPLNEGGYTTAPMPGAVAVKDTAGKVVATAKNPAAAAAFQKGDITLGNPDEMKEDSSDAASDKREALAKQIYDLGFNIHQNDGYGQDTSQEQAMLAKLKAEFARLHPGEDAFKIGKALNDRAYQQRQQQRDTEFKQNQQAKSRSTGIMQKAKNALGGMFEEDIGKHNNATTGFDALVRKLTPKYGKEAAIKIAGKQAQKIKEADQPPRDALASPLTLEAKKPDANKNGIPDYAEDGKGKNDLKKKKVKEGMDQKLNAARSEGKAHGLRGHSHCGKNYENMEEARCYHEGYKEGLDECYGQTPIQGYVGETTPVVNTMASYGAEEGELAEADIEESPFSWAASNTDKGDKFSVGGKEFVKNDAFAFEALDKQLNALLEDKEVTEGMTVSISKGQQGSPDSVSVSAQDGEADQLLSVIKSAGLGLFGGDEMMGQASPEPMTVDNGGEPSEVGAGGAAIEVVDDHDGMMNLMKKLSGIGGGEHAHSHDEESEETCESCGGMMEAEHSCSKDKEMVDEVESEDQMTDQMAEDNPPDSGAAEVDAEDADVDSANAAAAAYNPSDDVDEGSEASDVGNDGVEAGDAEEEMQASMNDEDEKQKDGLDESSFFNLYKKLSMLSEESTSEKDDDKAEEAGKKVKKDIEHDDKEDKKDKKDKVDESYANSADDTFETDIDFMMNVISGGLNKRKSTGQTTIPVVASQLNRTASKGTTDINESSNSVAAWKKLAGIK